MYSGNGMTEGASHCFLRCLCVPSRGRWELTALSQSIGFQVLGGNIPLNIVLIFFLVFWDDSG